jgi:3-oxoacyl-[acyl-carrier-protein] synthase II
MAERRIVVTGIGTIASIGATREAVWNGLVEGRSGIGPVTLFDPAGFRSRLAAEIPDLDAAGHFTPLERRRLSRCDRAAIVASAEALADAGLTADDIDARRAGVMLGSGTADLLRNEDYLADLRARGFAGARPSKVFNHFPSTPVDAVGERFSFRGPRACVVAACSSSTIAIGYAADAIRRHEIDVALAGGSDVLCRLTFSGFNALRLIDLEPCRPFDSARAGMTIGEAAAVVVLEDFDGARRRGAPVYAEIVGYSATCEAYHPTSPEPEGRAVAATIRAALERARVAADDVDHVNAHGTGTLHNDRAEARAIGEVFGERRRRLPVTSIKAAVGHCLGAAGAIEAAALAMSISRGVIPPTLRHTMTDPECDVDVVANDAREAKVRCGVSMSLAFGGNDAALVMRAV